MQPILSRRTIARLLFITGILFLLAGSLIIAGTEHAYFFVFLMILGVGCSVAAAIMIKNPLYMFFSAYSLQAGLFLFLVSFNYIPLTFAQAWPLLAIFSGAAIIPSGLYLTPGQKDEGSQPYRCGVIKSRYLVYSLAFIVLGAVLLVFSLDLVPISLTQFVKDWWPLLIILWGVLLMLVSPKRNNTDNIR